MPSVHLRLSAAVHNRHRALLKSLRSAVEEPFNLWSKNIFSIKKSPRWRSLLCSQRNMLSGSDMIDSVSARRRSGRARCPEKLMCVREERARGRGWCWWVDTVENGYWKICFYRSINCVVLNRIQYDGESVIYTVAAVSLGVYCASPRFLVLFHCSLSESWQMAPAAELIGNQYLRPLTVIKQMVKWSWTEVLRGLMNFFRPVLVDKNRIPQTRSTSRKYNRVINSNRRSISAIHHLHVHPAISLYKCRV